MVRPHDTPKPVGEDRTSAPCALRFTVDPHADRVLADHENHEGIFAGFDPERDWQVLATVIEDLLHDLVTPHEVYALCEDDGARLLVYVRGAHGHLVRLASEHVSWWKFGDRSLRSTAFLISVAKECAQMANCALADLHLATGYTAPPPGPPPT